MVADILKSHIVSVGNFFAFFENRRKQPKNSRFVAILRRILK